MISSGLLESWDTRTLSSHELWLVEDIRKAPRSVWLLDPVPWLRANGFVGLAVRSRSNSVTVGTVSDWLYPLSSKSAFRFVMPDGSITNDTSPANFEASVLRASPDDQTVAQNYKQIRRGDRMWIYYGRADGDLGVVGLATVSGIDAPFGRRADVHLRWDKKRTRHLILDPLPASEVRKFVWPRAAVANLSPHPGLIRRLERQSGAVSGKTPVAQFAKAKGGTITYVPPAQITVHRRHDALIGPVATRLGTCGWHSIPFDVSPMRADLAVAKKKCILLIEFKTIARFTFRPVREAFAQLHEYSWRHRMLHPQERRKIELWAVLERRPSDDDIRLLEDSGVLVSWASSKARRLIHGSQTTHRLARLSIVG